jgi:hypothetical protein
VKTNKLLLVIATLTITGAGWGQAPPPIEEPAGCLQATATNNGLCKLIYPNGVILATLVDGTTWMTIHGADEPVSFQISKGMVGAGNFRTNIIMNLPESDVVGAPQSAKMMVEGECQSKTYVIDTITDFAGKMGSGLITTGFVGGDDFERVARRVPPNSPMERVFATLCSK